MDLGALFSNKFIQKLIPLLGLDVEWGTHIFSGTLTANDPDIASLRWTGLVIGEPYCLTMQAQLNAQNDAQTAKLTAIHDGVEILEINHDRPFGTSATSAMTAGSNRNFTATTTTVTFSFSTSGTGQLTSAQNATFAQLEKLPFHKNTLV